MKIIKTAKYNKLIKKAQIEGPTEGQTVDVFARYIGDGYLSSAEYASEVPDGMGDNYWADSYDSDQNPDEAETVLLENVPLDIAKKLVAQGTSDQWFSDGYEAANVAAQYINSENENKYETPDVSDSNNINKNIDNSMIDPFKR